MPGETANVLTIEQSGTYTVQGAPAVCPALITPLGLELEYTVLPDPEVTVAVTENQLSTSDGISWQWIYNGDTLLGATQATLLASESGQYQVWVDFGQGCLVLSDPVDVVVTLTEAIIENAIAISPNPFEQSIRLFSIEPVRYCLRDVNGRVVASGNAAGNDEIHVKNLEAGIYIFEYSINNNERNHKLLIKK
jgi:hypothetical protein